MTELTDRIGALLGNDPICSGRVCTDTIELIAGLLQPEQPASCLPAGEYAIVEVLGHRTLIGRIAEVERFGAKMLAIEPINAGARLPAVMIGGASLYALTSCSADVALARSPKHEWQLPPNLRATLQAAALPAPEAADDHPWLAGEDA